MTSLRWGSATDVGLVRKNNEDQLLVAAPLFAVADGMGGHNAGEVASQIAVDTLAEAFGEDGKAEDLVAAMHTANRAVWDRAAGDQALRGMGTTLTALAVVEADDGTEELAVVNVGDSRAYLLRNGELEQLTEDHNVPGELLRKGEITAAEAAIHPQKNLITRVMGPDPEVEVDLWQLVPYEGDRLLLASDGLVGEVPDEKIASILRGQPDPEAAAAELIELARGAGGADNITVVIVDVLDDDGRVEAASEALAAAPASARTAAIERDDLEEELEDGGTPTATLPPGAMDDVLGRSEPARRSVTGRTVAFVLLLLVLLGTAFGVLTWYGQSAYHVGLQGDRVTIFRGRPGGFLWMEPSVAETTRIRQADVLPSRRDALARGKQSPSLEEARRYVDRLVDEKSQTTTTTSASTPAPAPTSTAPASTAPASTAPPGPPPGAP